MKKSELLLQLAELKYPKGTKFISGTDWRFISTGLFTTYKDSFHLSGHKNSIWRMTIDGGVGGLVYDSENDKWAEILTGKPKSILDGEVAIKIENERELELFKQYLKDVKNIQCSIMLKTLEEKHENAIVPLNYSGLYGYNRSTLTGYKTVSFEEFAKETGIEVPVFIMKSEDGVNILRDGNVGSKILSSD